MNWKLIAVLLFAMPLINQAGANELSGPAGGIYEISAPHGFTYAPDRSFGNNYVFENGELSVYLMKQPLPATRESRNNQLYTWMVNLFNTGFYQEKGRSKASGVKFLNNKQTHFYRFGRPKGVSSDEKVYLMLYTIGDKLYRVIVYAPAGNNQPPEVASKFIEAIRLKN